MSGFVDSDTPLIEGFSGMPIRTEPEYGPPTGSVDWLLNAVERHASAEAESLTLYARIAEDSADPVVKLVMRLILEDEQKHHALLGSIEHSLRDALNWSHSADALPIAAIPQQPISAKLAVVARELVEEERTGARKMRTLAHHEKDIDAGLHSLLLEMMAMDSDKHARMLQFVQHRLDRRTVSQNGPVDSSRS